MSIPTIKELEDLIHQINCEIYETIGTEYITCTVITDGFAQTVEMFGIPIWDSESDDRNYIDEEDDIQESMDVFLRRQMMEELAKLSKILLVPVTLENKE